MFTLPFSFSTTVRMFSSCVCGKTFHWNFIKLASCAHKFPFSTFEFRNLQEDKREIRLTTARLLSLFHNLMQTLTLQIHFMALVVV